MFFYIGHTINAPEVTSAWGGTSQAEKPEQKGHSSLLPLPHRAAHSASLTPPRARHPRPRLGFSGVAVRRVDEASAPGQRLNPRTRL